MTARARRKKAKRRQRKLQAKVDGWPRPLPRSVAIALNERYHRCDVEQYDDHLVGLGFGGVGSVPHRSISFAALKKRWRSATSATCLRCGGPQVGLRSTPSVSMRACLRCKLSFADSTRAREDLVIVRIEAPPPEVVSAALPWWQRTPRRIGWPSPRMARAMWAVSTQRSLRKAWEEREVDGLRDHFEALPFETNIEALRAPGRRGASMALLKRLWRRDEDAPRCVRCRLPWRAMIEDRPLRAPLVVVGFDVVEAEDSDVLVAHRICVGGCARPTATRSPWSIDELLA